MPRTSTRLPSFSAALALAVSLQACEGINSPEPALLVEARVAPGHIHSFETDVTFAAKITRSGGGATVQDFSEIHAEIGPAGSGAWTKRIPLAFDGTEYSGSTKFTANGSFDARIVGRRPGQSEATEIHRYAAPLAAVRPHFDAGGYRVEFETDTGEYPAVGESVTFRFLIMEDVASPRPPIAGLPNVTIRCVQGSDVAVHSAAESPAGTYSASHTFSSMDEASAQIEFIGTDQTLAIVQIPLVVE